MTYKKAYVIYITYALLTACAIFFAAFTRELTTCISWVNLGMEDILGSIMNTTAVGIYLKRILALALTPIVIVAIPTGVYWGFKREMPPYVIQIVWVLWIIAAMSHLLSQ